jgi:hypothetical protein
LDAARGAWGLLRALVGAGAARWDTALGGRHRQADRNRSRRLNKYWRRRLEGVPLVAGSGGDCRDGAGGFALSALSRRVWMRVPRVRGPFAPSRFWLRPW